MFGLALVFFVAALVSAWFGYAGGFAAAAPVAQVLFWLFVGLFVVVAIAGMVRNARRPRS